MQKNGLAKMKLGTSIFVLLICVTCASCKVGDRPPQISPKDIVATPSPNAVVVAPSPLDIAAQGEKMEDEENCGPHIEELVTVESRLNPSRPVATKNYQECSLRNFDRRNRNGKRETALMEKLVFRTRDVCTQVIRRTSQAPSTLSIDYGKPYSWMSGLNGSGVDITEGGYSVNVTGSSAIGRFSVTCYMDKNYVVTHVR